MELIERTPLVMKTNGQEKLISFKVGFDKPVVKFEFSCSCITYQYDEESNIVDFEYKSKKLKAGVSQYISRRSMKVLYKNGEVDIMQFETIINR